MSDSNIMATIYQEQTITHDDLTKPDKDEATQARIKRRCQSFKLPEEDLQSVAAKSGRESEAINVGVSAFDKHVGNEKRIVESYQSEIKDRLAQLYPALSKEKADLEKLTKEGRDRRSDRTIVNIPPHLKLQQVMLTAFAWILVAAGSAQLAIFLHNQTGMEWWQAFVVPFSGVIGLSWGVKVGLTTLYDDHYAVYKVLKYIVLLLGMGSFVAWIIMYSQYSVTLAQGPQFATLDGPATGDTGGHGTHLMIALQVLGEAFVAGFLFTRASEITAKHTTRDGIDYTEEFKHDKMEADAIQAEIEFANSRMDHTETLLSQLESARKDAEAQSAAFFGKYRPVH